jgi:hypothetical protein
LTGGATTNPRESAVKAPVVAFLASSAGLPTPPHPRALRALSAPRRPGPWS